MRRGRALLPHPKPQRDDTGRTLASRQVVAELTQRHPDVIRKRVPVVACHIATGCLLVDIEEAEKILKAIPQRPWQKQQK